MSNTGQASIAVSMAAADAPPEPALDTPLLDRTRVVFPLLIGVGLLVFAAAFLTIHQRSGEELSNNSGATRTHREVMHWLQDGYFHDCGLLVWAPTASTEIYRSSTGGYVISAFLLQKIYVAFTGHYSWRLTALHNQIVMLLLSSVFGMLAYRLARRMALQPRLAFALAAAAIAVVFTFPSNLFLYWEMSAQAYALLFAAVFLVIEERRADGELSRKLALAQAGAMFLATYMEYVFGLTFLGSMILSRLLLGLTRTSWRRFIAMAIIPCAAAFAVYFVQLTVASARFPQAKLNGSSMLFRTGLDGESIYYGDHLDIAHRRDVARVNFPANREHLFVWKSVFILGTACALALIAAFIAGRAPRTAVETVIALTGSWLLYAAVFSQAVLIHPYLYDILLFAPLALVLFAIAPALLESFTRRTGAIVMIVVFSACWYTMFQMRLYALWYPAPGARIAPPAVASP